MVTLYDVSVGIHPHTYRSFFFLSPRSAKIYVIVKNGWIFSYLGIIAQKIYP